jgi:hypothetical protein
MVARAPVLILLSALAGCTDYDLQRKDEGAASAEPADSGTPGETADPVGDDTGEIIDSGSTTLPPEAALDPLYAHTADKLFSVSPEDPNVLTLIGTFTDVTTGGPMSEITDIAIDSGGILYAMSFTSLYRVDATSAVATFVGSSGESDINALSFLADGTLLAGGGSSLYRVDPATGNFTRLDSIGAYSFAGDMVGLPDGLLYCAMTGGGMGTTLVVFDPATGGIVRDGLTGTGPLYGVAYANETLYGFSSEGLIYTLDPTSGAGARVATDGPVWYGATTNPVAWE